MTCVNGTLFSLLKREEFREEAVKAELEQAVHSALEQADESLKNQLDCVLEALAGTAAEEEDQPEEENVEEGEVAFDDDESLNEDISPVYYKELKEVLISSKEMEEEEMAKVGIFMEQQIISERSRLISQSQIEASKMQFNKEKGKNKEDHNLESLLEDSKLMTYENEEE